MRYSDHEQRQMDIASGHELDRHAMRRRDKAAEAGARLCPTCDGTGAVQDDPEVRGAYVECHKCCGETWIDAQGRPYKID